MVQSTTPTFTLTFPPSVDFSTVDVWFTIEQGRVSITKTGEDLAIDHNVIGVFLSQEDTTKFEKNISARIQVNWVYPNGERACSNIVTVPVGENLLRKVLE